MVNGITNLLSECHADSPVLFTERATWVEKLGLVHNTSVPLLSPLYPKVACDAAGDICIFTTGESEINAAAST